VCVCVCVCVEGGHGKHEDKKELTLELTRNKKNEDAVEKNPPKEYDRINKKEKNDNMREGERGYMGK